MLVKAVEVNDAAEMLVEPMNHSITQSISHFMDSPGLELISHNV